RLDLATQAGGIGVWSCGRKSHALSWNDQMYDLFGLPTGSPLSCDGWRHMIDSEDRAFLEAFLEGAARSGEAFQMEVRVMTPEGIRRHLGLAARMERSEPQGEGAFIGVCWDLTALKETELSLRRQGTMLKLLAETSSRCIDLPPEEVPGAIRDALGRLGSFVGAHRAYAVAHAPSSGGMPCVHEWCAGDEPCSPRGFPLEELSSWVSSQRRGSLLLTVDVASLPMGEMRRHMEDRGCGGLLVVPMLSGEEHWGVVGFEGPLPWKNLSDQDGALFGLFAQIVVNARRRIQAEERIRHLAAHDFLTDLPKLPLARDRLTMALGAARRYRHRVAVMFLDLDGFKAVNDTFGHDAGDEVLRHVARVFRQSLRETDTVARVGGDEFLMVITELALPEHAALVAEKVLRALESPIPVPGGTARVGASIGIALYPDHGANDESLIKAADDAMYRVKFAGKNGYRFADDLAPSDEGGSPTPAPPES
ncbi:MAG TPA: diguanylate cyclase, partial [Synergistaceae bacterium]|nr:diguanylate cyclase [Synergistaceae bacterium]